jgi:tetratricopeptide (TPR) repeat protein
MVQPREYKRTFFDRQGPDGAETLRVIGYGVMIFALTSIVLALKLGFHWRSLAIGLVAGIVCGGIALSISRFAGGAVTRIFVAGSSTPYREQYSFQQALVMRGQVDEALASFEALIAVRPTDVEVRINAAEVLAREKRDYQRAADMFRSALKIASITAGEDVYVTHRLVDLLTGPLETPGRALVELRRLIDRYPGTAAASQARSALAAVKSRSIVESD